MSKTNFNRIMAGLNDVVAIAEGRADPATYRIYVPRSIDVKGLRTDLGLSQKAFAARYGFTVGAVRDWEQGRAVPEGANRAYLIVIAKEPDAVDRALGVG